jgi:hypothetical protein
MRRPSVRNDASAGPSHRLALRRLGIPIARGVAGHRWPMRNRPTTPQAHNGEATFTLFRKFSTTRVRAIAQPRGLFGDLTAARRRRAAEVATLARGVPWTTASIDGRTSRVRRSQSPSTTTRCQARSPEGCHRERRAKTIAVARNHESGRLCRHRGFLLTRLLSPNAQAFPRSSRSARTSASVVSEKS